MLVGGERGTRGIDRQVVALGALIGLDGKERTSKINPAYHIIAVEHDRLRVSSSSASGIVAGSLDLVAFRPQFVGAALGLPLGLEIGLVAFGVGRDARVHEALFVGSSLYLHEADDEQRGNEGEDKTESEEHGALGP